MELTFASFLAAGDSAPAIPAGEPRIVERRHRTWLVPGFKRRFEPSWHGHAFCGVLCLLIGVGLLAGGISSWRAATLENASYRTDGVDADCAVTSRRIVDDQHGRSYVVACAYPVASQQLAASFGVPELRYRDLAPGTKIPVRYLRADPERVRMRDRTYDAIGLLLMAALLGIGVTMGGVALLEQGVKRRRDEKRLEREGVLLSGRVVDCIVGCFQPKYGPPCHTMSLTYRFTCPCGTEVFGHETFSRYEKFDDMPKDAPLCVAFADARCFRVL